MTWIRYQKNETGGKIIHMLCMKQMTKGQEERLIEKFHGGHCTDAYRYFGVHFLDAVKGEARFTVFAPHARSVSLTASFTDWDVHAVPLVRTGFTGIWQVIVCGVRVSDTYKFRIETGHGTLYKSDPYAFASEDRPGTASVVYDPMCIKWHDAAWLEERTLCYDKPCNIYEVHAGAWRKDCMTYRALAEKLVPYVKEMGFTHIELMPITEYPYDGSWGYQAVGYYAPTSRYGSPQDLAHFVDVCHQEGIGVILDIVPVHFANDAHGLACFDGSPLYEYRRSYDAQSAWGTLNFDLWNEEVRSFLMSVCSFWAEVYHIDGFRIDAVSHMIYWGGDQNRGVNEGGLQFMHRLNYYMHQEHPGVMMIAEDSSAFPHVTGQDGLGFDYKWDMGWMNDTLSYFGLDPFVRGKEQKKFTFAMDYYWSERFMSPLSHDENVHGKGTIIAKMWGDYDQKFAQLRALYAYMYARPGKKLNFMGNEIAMFREFDEDRELDWFLLDYEMHRKFQIFFKEMCRQYLQRPALYKRDHAADGFQRLIWDDSEKAVFAFCRKSDEEVVVCVLNLAGTRYDGYVVPMPVYGKWECILDTADETYGGRGASISKMLYTDVHGDKAFLTIRLDAFEAVWLYHSAIE